MFSISSHYSDKLVIQHYDTKDGIGNAYLLVADWPSVFKAVLFGWENVLEHPAAVHYARDFDGKNLNQALKRTGSETFEKLKVKSGKILDCGCGVGGTTLSLSLLYPDISFYGVSLSPGQITTAQKRAAKANCKNVRYIIANYLKLPFDDDYFDGILGIETFCHVEDKDKNTLFKELFRVLKSGCRVVISDAFLNDRPEAEMHMPYLHQRIFRGWTLPDKISTVKFVMECAKNNGFDVSLVSNITKRILGCSKEASKRAKLLKPLTPLVKIAIKLRKLGIKLPVFSTLGLDNELILEFAYTSEFQYDMFKSGDAEYFELVLTKP